MLSGKVLVAPDLGHSAAEGRFLALGRGQWGRPMVAAFTFRVKGGLNLIRVISARHMHAKEAQHYEKAFTPQDEH
jgi:uncharacterized DUF497 family protein